MEAKTEKPASIEAQVAEWSATDANLREAVEATKGVTVAGFLDDKGAPNPKKGRDVVHAKMMTLTNLRTGIEARRVELKAPILSLGRLVDSEAARLTGIVKGREDELRADRDAFDAEQKKIAEAAAAELRRKEEADRAERARILQARVDLVASLGGAPNLGWLSSATEEAFAEMVADLEKAKAEREDLARIAAEEKAEADRIEAERLKAEAARLEKESADRRAAEAAEAEERKRLQAIEDAKRAEEERKLAEERAALEADRKKLEADKLAAEAAEWARKERDRLEEEARIEAEREAKRKAQEAEDAERRAKQVEAEKPDRVRAAEWARKVINLLDVIPEFGTPSIRADVVAASEFCADEMRALINRMEAK
ncbi:MAG: hypothetical protein ACYC6J_08615 [Coriobacteriia bacterium]